MRNNKPQAHESCKQPLPVKDGLGYLSPVMQRVISFDPRPVFERMQASGVGDSYKRVNSLFVGYLFPTEVPGVCACGCGGKLSGRNTRYATKECRQFVLRVYFILVGAFDWYKMLVYEYNGGYACSGCGDMQSDTQIDHIIPVWAGGGLCWLSNFQILCTDCHKEKRKADRNKY